MKHTDPRYKLTPSRVVYLRNIPLQASDSDVNTFAKRFGDIKNMIHQKSGDCGSALIEYQHLSSAISFVTEMTKNPIKLFDRTVLVTFSDHHQLTNPSKIGPLQEDEVSRPVLFIIIRNVLFTVTPDLLQKIFSQYGMVKRIIIFQKKGI